MHDEHSSCLRWSQTCRRTHYVKFNPLVLSRISKLEVWLSRSHFLALTWSSAGFRWARTLIGVAPQRKEAKFKVHVHLKTRTRPSRQHQKSELSSEAFLGILSAHRLCPILRCTSANHDTHSSGADYEPILAGSCFYSRRTNKLLRRPWTVIEKPLQPPHSIAALVMHLIESVCGECIPHLDDSGQGKRLTPLENSPCTNDSFCVDPSTNLLEPICSVVTRIPWTSVMDCANPASPMYTATNGHLLVSDDHLMCSLFANTAINVLPCPPRYLLSRFL